MYKNQKIYLHYYIVIALLTHYSFNFPNQKSVLFLLITTQRGRGGRAGQIGSGVNIADDDRDTCEDDSGPSSISARGLSPDCH